MARNLKREYINKILAMPVPNGYRFDLANYLHNPSYDYDYPSFKKVISEDGDNVTYRRVLYFKYFGGTGEYQEEFFTVEKSGAEWQVCKKVKKNVLAESNRFSLKTLLSFC